MMTDIQTMSPEIQLKRNATDNMRFLTDSMLSVTQNVCKGGVSPTAYKNSDNRVQYIEISLYNAIITLKASMKQHTRGR
jgi:hypothetical protein